MHRYNTRFQARNPVQVPKEQVPVPKEQAPKEQAPIQKEQVQVQDSQLRNEARALQPLLDRQYMGDDRIKNAFEIFAFLADRSTLLSHPPFLEVVIKKIEEFRPEMEKRKNDAIKTFVSTYAPFNTCLEQNELLAARNALYYIPRLESKINMVEAIIRKSYK
jgi:hypothetical protein